MTNTIGITYKDVFITYNCETNKWECEWNGKTYALDSLNEAKARVDAPLPKLKTAFKRIPIFRSTYSSGFVRGEITSFAGLNYISEQEVWIVADGKRQKVALNLCVLDTAENRTKIAEWQARKTEIENLRQQNDQLLASMEPPPAKPVV